MGAGCAVGPVLRLEDILQPGFELLSVQPTSQPVPTLITHISNVGMQNCTFLQKAINVKHSHFTLFTFTLHALHFHTSRSSVHNPRSSIHIPRSSLSHFTLFNSHFTLFTLTLLSLQFTLHALYFDTSLSSIHTSRSSHLHFKLFTFTLHALIFPAPHFIHMSIKYCKRKGT